MFYLLTVILLFAYILIGLLVSAYIFSDIIETLEAIDALYISWMDVILLILFLPMSTFLLIIYTIGIFGIYVIDYVSKLKLYSKLTDKKLIKKEDIKIKLDKKVK